MQGTQFCLLVSIRYHPAPNLKIEMPCHIFCLQQQVLSYLTFYYIIVFSPSCLISCQYCFGRRNFHLLHQMISLTFKQVAGEIIYLRYCDKIISFFQGRSHVTRDHYTIPQERLKICTFSSLSFFQRGWKGRGRASTEGISTFLINRLLGKKKGRKEGERLPFLRKLFRAIDHMVAYFFLLKIKTNAKSIYLLFFAAQPFVANVLIQFLNVLYQQKDVITNIKLSGILCLSAHNKNVKQILMKGSMLVGYSQSDMEF